MISPDDVLFFAVLFLGIFFITLHLYLMHKLRVIIGKLIDILFQLENNFLASKIPEKIKAVKISKNCQACKYRLAFYNQDAKIPDHFYYRCQITHQRVPPDFLCKDFVFDPQTYHV